MEVLRQEYPRPSFVREDWLSLNGEWDFCFDDSNLGLSNEWYRRELPESTKIRVPFAYQSKLSGIANHQQHDIVWYQRRLALPSKWYEKQILVNFGAVDYACTVWVNGKLAGCNKGGYVQFSLDITSLLQEPDNLLTVRVVDHPSTSQPRGKQRARKENYGCWYTPVTGIWQSVWLEAVDVCHLQRVKLEPNINENTVKVNYWLSTYQQDVEIECVVYEDNKEKARVSLPFSEQHNFFSDITPRCDGSLVIPVPNAKLWSPEKPFLYDVVFNLYQDKRLIDRVQTYVGMREVQAKDGKVLLNNRPYYLRMVLDQGYWPEGIYTAERIDAIKYDVEMTKNFGFNGARKHQKFEDPYYYYFCDKLGLLTWCEMPACYYYNEEVSQNMTDEWQRLVIAHYNHPSVIAWVPVNESWGVDQLKEIGSDPRPIHHMLTLYHLTKSIDPTRLVVGNDGWQQATTDIIAIHEYVQDPAEFKQRYASFKANRQSKSFSHNFEILLEGFPYRNQPIMITEFGGVRIHDGGEGWGYGESAKDSEDLVRRIASLVDVIVEEEELCGYCYTQLTDVEQEVNGLLTFDRKQKVNPEKLAAIFRGR